MKITPGDAMSYSFTEKKRIRKSFAKRERVQDMRACARYTILAHHAA
ncbi:MAG: hypothetical protein RLZZ250_932 [Pseudomonadota bacterium]